MDSHRRRRFRVLTLVAATAVLELGKNPALAIYEFGFGVLGKRRRRPALHQ